MITKGEFAFGRDYIFGCRTMPPVQPVRLGLIFPVAFFVKIGGVNEITMVAYPFILSMLSIPLIYIIGREIFSSERAGLTAAFIQAILPVDVKSATMLLPDLSAAFWANLGIILLYFGFKRDRIISKSAYGCLGGLAFLISWLCKEGIFYLFPFVAGFSIWMIYKGKRNFYMLSFAGLIFAFGILAESLLYYRHTEDLLYRFHEIDRNFEHGKMWFFTEGSFVGYEKGQYLSALFRRLVITGPRTILATISFGFTTIVACLALVYALYKRWRSYVFIGAWFVSLAIMFNFFSPNLKAYEPLYLRARDLYPMFLPAVLLTSGLISYLLSRKKSISDELFRERLFWGGVLSLCILLVCSLKLCQDILILNDGSPNERAVSRVLSPTDVVYTDARTKEILSFFWGFPTETQTYDFSGMNSNDIPKESYILINRKRADGIHKAYGYVLPTFYENVPTEWENKWGTSQAKLYKKTNQE
jgi:4-amino-4-deoxy-L-arabinose transferase-like glycosyltransferase